MSKLQCMETSNLQLQKQKKLGLTQKEYLSKPLGIQRRLKDMAFCS